MSSELEDAKKKLTLYINTLITYRRFEKSPEFGYFFAYDLIRLIPEARNLPKEFLKKFEKLGIKLDNLEVICGRIIGNELN